MMALAPAIVTCASGGQPKRPGGAGGYAYTFEGQVPQLLFHDADPGVVEAFVARHERDPCDGTLATGSTMNTLLLSRVRVPVFLYYGLEDALWPAGTGERQRRLFTGSDDVMLFEAAGTGHMMMLERSAPAFRSAMSSWLKARGF
jgi:pimeloyl-ACP methyl ester carboxylesterase